MPRIGPDGRFPVPAKRALESIGASNSWLYPRRNGSGGRARGDRHRRSPLRNGKRLAFAASAGGANRQIALQAAAQTIRLAENVWKYGAQDAPSGTLATTVPLDLPSAAPTTVPLTIEALLSRTGASARLRVIVTYPLDGFRRQTGRVTQDAVLHVAAPLPGSTLLVSPSPNPVGRRDFSQHGRHPLCDRLDGPGHAWCRTFVRASRGSTQRIARGCGGLIARLRPLAPARLERNRARREPAGIVFGDRRLGLSMCRQCGPVRLSFTRDVSRHIGRRKRERMRCERKLRTKSRGQRARKRRTPQCDDSSGRSVGR